MTTPTIRSFHLGAGRQSTAIALLINQGILPKPDIVLFADTGIEPAAVYRHLNRIETELLNPVGVELRRVSHGNLETDILSPHAFATIPAFTLKLVPKQQGFLTWTDRQLGRQKRRCTGKYKIEPLQREERLLLGATKRRLPCKYCDATGQRLAPWNAKLLTELGLTADDVDDDWAKPGPCRVCNATGQRTIIGAAPAGALAEVWIGYDATEAAMRINDNQFATYQRPHYPLLDLPRPAERIADDQRRQRHHRKTGWTLADCLWYLNQHGWRDTVKSACIPCPQANNKRWRQIRDTCDCRHHARRHLGHTSCLDCDCDCTAFQSSDWAHAVKFDRDFRTAPGLDAQRFLHPDCVPLDQANIDQLTGAERTAAQGDFFDLLYGTEGDEEWAGCSPHGCGTALAEVA